MLLCQYIKKYNRKFKSDLSSNLILLISLYLHKIQPHIIHLRMSKLLLKSAKGLASDLCLILTIQMNLKTANSGTGICHYLGMKHLQFCDCKKNACTMVSQNFLLHSSNWRLVLLSYRNEIWYQISRMLGANTSSKTHSSPWITGTSNFGCCVSPNIWNTYWILPNSHVCHGRQMIFEEQNINHKKKRYSFSSTPDRLL
jgi:hypothetical protein